MGNGKHDKAIALVVLVGNGGNGDGGGIRVGPIDGP